ncbi:MAG: hypothetical protein ACO2ZP_10920 [Bacteriovoracaceae bacterium]
MSSGLTPELCEDNIPDLTRLKDTVDEDIQVILCGSSFSANYALGILEQFKDRKIQIFYIKPDTELLSGQSKLQENAIFGILQEYTRSGLFENMTIISNTKVEEIVGNVPVKNYFSTLNQTIYYVIHYMNYFANKQPIIGNLTNPTEIQRIRTFGMINPANLSEKMFYELDMARDTSYYVCITSSRLETDGTLHKKLVNTLKNKPRNAFKNLSYAIYESNTENDFGFCIAHTNAVQSNS